MGVKIPDIRIVINWGSPSSLLRYWQQVGRCIRDGKPGLALLYAFPRSLVSASEDMKDLVACQSCKRVKVLDQFVLDELDDMNIETEKQYYNGCES